MSNTLKEIVKEIQFRKNWTVEEVAKSIKYSRVHLTREMAKGDNKELIDLLKERHKDLLTVSNETPDDTKSIRVPEKDKQKAIDALISVLVTEVAGLKSTLTGENQELIIKKIYRAAEDVAKLG